MYTAGETNEASGHMYTRALITPTGLRYYELVSLSTSMSNDEKKLHVGNYSFVV